MAEPAFPETGAVDGKWSQPIERTPEQLDAEISMRSASLDPAQLEKPRESETAVMSSSHNAPVSTQRSSLPIGIPGGIESHLNTSLESATKSVEEAQDAAESEMEQAPQNTESAMEPDPNGVTEAAPDISEKSDDIEIAGSRHKALDAGGPAGGIAEDSKSGEVVESKETPSAANDPSDSPGKVAIKRDTRFFDRLKNRTPSSQAIAPPVLGPDGLPVPRKPTVTNAMRLEPLDKRNTLRQSPLQDSATSGKRSSMLGSGVGVGAGIARSSTHFSATTMDMVDVLADQDAASNDDGGEEQEDQTAELLPSSVPASDEKEQQDMDDDESHRNVHFNVDTSENSSNARFKVLASMKKPVLSSVFDFKEDDAPEWRQRVLNFMNSYIFTIMSLVVLFLALFADDIRLAVCPMWMDRFFVGLTYFLFAAYSLDMVVLCVVKPKYMFSFYFFIDLLATASFVFDVPLVQEAIMESPGEGAADSVSLIRASRTSRFGTRAGRVARLVRIMRLVRVLKIFRMMYEHLAKVRSWTSVSNFEGDEIEDDEKSRTSESRVGVKLTELTTKRVIVGVLMMLFILPFFAIESGYYGSPSSFAAEGLYMVHNMYCTSGNSTEFNVTLMTYNASVSYQMAGRESGDILNLTVSDYVVANSPLDRRPIEKRSYHVVCSDEEVIEPLKKTFGENAAQAEHMIGSCCKSTVTVDNRWPSQFEAILSICRTVFVCFVLVLGSLLFSRDANALVLHPLERMVQKVKEMSENPLAKMQIRAVATKDEQQMETRILENSITKICSLLAVGFGDAGAQVVAENIRNGGDLNPMVPGHKMMAIFGFCDIRRFTDATEVLQEEVMEFVNSIAKIVHMEVSLHGGSANKNIGDAFLLVWKLPTQLLPSNAMDEQDLAAAAAQLPRDKRNSIAYLADRALAAFVVIQVALKRSPRLKQFCMRDDIRKRIGDNYRVSMGFGLHIGWAIEGAIGSEYKIDASYLSPNVNMASRLEAATKQFGTSILMSDDFATMLSPRVRKLCRAIDVITVKGSNKPVTLYTYDISLNAIAEPDENKFQDDNMENLSHSFLSFKSEFEENPDITESIGSTQEYRDHFALGFQAYLDGRWEESRDLLLVCLNRIDPTGGSCTDGPTASLLEVMGRSDFIAPRSWDGVRHLTDK